jgi:hypothetical protein
MDDLLKSASAVLSITPARWVSMAKIIPAEVLGRKPAVGEWSALECLQHLIDTETVFQTRTEAFLAGRNFSAFDPDSQGTKPDADATPLALATMYTRLRGASLDILARLGPADLERRAIHQELGEVTLSQMIHEWAAHDLMHTVQAEQAMMQPFIQGCGPWVTYFMEHFVEQG